MHSATHVASDAIRARFSDAMSAMYRKEVPLYGELLDIVAAVNARALAEMPPWPMRRGPAERQHAWTWSATAPSVSVRRRSSA